MNRAKKLIALMLCLLLALPALALTEGYNGTAPVTAEEKTISVLATNGASLNYDFDNMTWWQEVLTRANIKLDYELIDSSSYQDVVRPRLAAAADLPDVVQIPGNDEDMSYINSGIFLDLTGYYDALAFNLDQQFEKHPNLKAEISTPEGAMYYLPYVFTTDSNMRCLMLNDSYLQALGMTVEDVNTMEDYYNYLVQVKHTDVNGNGDPNDEIPLFMRANMIQLWGMMWGLDLTDSGGFQVEDGQVICGYASDKYLEFLTWANKLYAEGLLYNEFATANYDTQQALYTSNQVGSVIHFISNCTGYSQAINPDWQFNVDEPIMQATAIEGPYGDKNVYGRDALGGFFGITNGCDDPETVFAFMDYLQSDEVGKLTWYGIEGVDYNIVDGEYVFTELYLGNKDDYLTKAGYNFSGLPSFQLDYMTKQCDQVRQMAADLAQYVFNPTVTFSFKLESENEVINSYAADLKTYFTENLTAFIMGTRPLSDWEAYLSTLDAMCLNDVIAVYQANYDRSAAQ